MKTITTSLHNAWSALLLAAAGAAWAAPGASVSTDKAEVSFRNPAGFTEMGRSFGARTDWLDELSNYVAKRAAGSVADGERLIVTITDVQRAGMIEPWRHSATDLRMVRETTPPRIDLNFQLVAANGVVLKEGSRQLRDFAFMTRSMRHRGDLLSYEKNLIDDWVRKDFEAAKRP